MTSTIDSQSPAYPLPEGTRFRGPIWALLILAPFIAEVLSGSTRLSYIVVLIPEIMVWGVGALLCREFVRRWRGGGTSLLLLGLALSVAEEFVIQQTSLAPLPWPGANLGYGRVFGVNWLYFLFMLGFESIWVVVVPVEVTELFFPARSSRPWLRKRGLIVCLAVFCLGSVMAWFSWTQIAMSKQFHLPPYHPPALALIAGVLAIAGLIFAAWMLRNHGHARRSATLGIIHPAAAGIAALLFGLAWWTLMSLVFVPRFNLALSIPITCAVVWAAAAFAFFQRVSASAPWGGNHRWASALGATLSCMAVPYLSAAGYSRLDLIAKVAFDLLALAGFFLLYGFLQRNKREQFEAAQ